MRLRPLRRDIERLVNVNFHSCRPPLLNGPPAAIVRLGGAGVNGAGAAGLLACHLHAYGGDDYPDDHQNDSHLEEGFFDTAARPHE